MAAERPKRISAGQVDAHRMRPQHHRRQLVPVGRRRPKESSPTLAVQAYRRGRLLQRTIEADRRAIIQRVRRRNVRLNPLDAENAPAAQCSGRASRAQEDGRRRRCRVWKPGQRKFGSTVPPTDRVLAFNYEDRVAGASESNSCRQPIGPGADNDGIIPWHRSVCAPV